MYQGFFYLLSHIALYNPHNDPMTTIVTLSLCSIVPKKSETKVKLLAEGPELGRGGAGTGKLTLFDSDLRLLTTWPTCTEH